MIPLSHGSAFASVPTWTIVLGFVVVAGWIVACAFDASRWLRDRYGDDIDWDEVDRQRIETRRRLAHREDSGYSEPLREGDRP